MDAKTQEIEAQRAKVRDIGARLEAQTVQRLKAPEQATDVKAGIAKARAAGDRKREQELREQLRELDALMRHGEDTERELTKAMEAEQYRLDDLELPGDQAEAEAADADLDATAQTLPAKINRRTRARARVADRLRRLGRARAVPGGGIVTADPEDALPQPSPLTAKVLEAFGARRPDISRLVLEPVVLQPLPPAA